MSDSDSKKRDHTIRSAAWRRDRIAEGHKRREVFFDQADDKRLAEAAKEEDETVAGLIRKIVRDWLYKREK